jgi:hypothetical protein
MFDWKKRIFTALTEDDEGVCFQMRLNSSPLAIVFKGPNGIAAAEIAQLPALRLAQIRRAFASATGGRPASLTTPF